MVSHAKFPQAEVASASLNAERSIIMVEVLDGFADRRHQYVDDERGQEPSNSPALVVVGLGSGDLYQ